MACGETRLAGLLPKTRTTESLPAKQEAHKKKINNFAAFKLIQLECNDISCAPPPIGTGGSNESAGGSSAKAPTPAGTGGSSSSTRPGFRTLTAAEKTAIANGTWDKDIGTTNYKIPPAWTDVQIAEDPNSPLVVVGKDAKGRSQYRYTAAHDAQQADIKFARTAELSKVIGKLDESIARDAPTNDTAAALALVRHFGLRPGSTTDTQAAQQAYGATTLQARHVRQYPETGRTTISFVGKKGVKITVSTTDKDIFALVASRMEGKSGSDSLFQTSDQDLRAYMDSSIGEGFHPKDLRTYHANATALSMVSSMRRPTTRAKLKVARNKVADAVAKQLGNSRTMALNSYINPTVFAEWEAQLV